MSWMFSTYLGASAAAGTSKKVIDIDEDTQFNTRQLQFVIKPWNDVSISVQINDTKMTVDKLI